MFSDSSHDCRRKYDGGVREPLRRRVQFVASHCVGVSLSFIPVLFVSVLASIRALW